MKIKLNLFIAALLFMLAASCLPAQKLLAQEDGYYNDDQYNQQQDEPYINPEGDVNFDVFYNDLSPYGNWIDYPSYGRVWVYRDRNFIPYSTGGHWAYTNFGWTWASDFDWGWAPFHYGRWSFDNRYGWFWVPGYEWGPAWVNWRTGGDYYGWAPLQPGISVNISFGFGNGIPADRWIFVPRRYIASPYIHNYIVPRSRNNIIVRNTTIIKNVNVYKNTRYVVGPNRRDVERYTGQRIQQQRVVADNKPGPTRITNNSVHIYRPDIKKTNVTINKNIKAQPPANNNGNNNNNQIDRNRDNRNNNINRGSLNNENANDKVNENRQNRDNNIDNPIKRDQPLNRVVTPPQNNSDNEKRNKPNLDNNNNDERRNARNFNAPADNNALLRRRQNDNPDNNTLQPQRSYTPPVNNNRDNRNNQMDNMRQSQPQRVNPSQGQLNRNITPPPQPQRSNSNDNQHHGGGRRNF